jgi:hypothetical protein
MEKKKIYLSKQTSNYYKEEYRINGKIMKEVWYKDDSIHNDNAPALVYAAGIQPSTSIECEQNLPSAIFRSNDEFHWYKNGKLHCNDGPAIINKHGHLDNYEYYQNGLLHNDNGPAVLRGVEEFSEKQWYQYGKLHREDGPAIVNKSIFHHNYKVEQLEHHKLINQWFLDGVEMTEKEWKKELEKRGKPIHDDHSLLSKLKKKYK